MKKKVGVILKLKRHSNYKHTMKMTELGTFLSASTLMKLNNKRKGKGQGLYCLIFFVFRQLEGIYNVYRRIGNIRMLSC